MYILLSFKSKYSIVFGIGQFKNDGKSLLANRHVRRKQVLPIRSCNIGVIYLMLEIDLAQRHKEYWLSQRNPANLCAARFCQY